MKEKAVEGGLDAQMKAPQLDEMEQATRRAEEEVKIEEERDYFTRKRLRVHKTF